MKLFSAASLAAFAAVSALPFCGSAVGATVTSIHGAVQINSGSGFRQVAGPAQVAPGTSVMAAPGASAEIVYSDRCRIPVRPGSVVVVSPISPCAQGQAGPDYTYNYVLGGTAAIGLGVGIWAATQNNNAVATVVSKPASP
jgi:hypothetical protein